MEDSKNLIRIATRIQEALMKLKKNRYMELLRQLASFAGQLQDVTTQSRKMGASLVHGWFSAADRCCSRVSRLLSDISYSASRIRPLTEGPREENPKLSTLVNELNQIKQEFGGIELNTAENYISVETESIELEGVYLGPFKIQLELDRLSELYKSPPYFVIALDQHPAATSEEVTHPHVSNEQLCEGDGSVAIRAALEQGRLSDFFTMARSILNTYNPDSPYISLYDWDGEPCYECTTCCRSCDETVCLGCAAKCEVCEEPGCPRCTRARCIKCKIVCCESCIDEGLCLDCQKESEVSNEEQGNQIERASENTGQGQSEASNSEIQLAS
ncbi:MAG: hypothetical protein ACYSSO_15385 [Planctomycetota bacterium]|jgi:hypothetical protein